MAVKFKVEALRTLASPYRREKEDESSFETIYYLLVDMKELPAGISLDVKAIQSAYNVFLPRKTVQNEAFTYECLLIRTLI